MGQELVMVGHTISNALYIKGNRMALLESGGPRRIRTPDPLIRSQVLYPAELSVRRRGSNRLWLALQGQKCKRQKKLYDAEILNLTLG